jgi:tetratricopeptide (TPR) repeat protein
MNTEHFSRRYLFQRSVFPVPRFPLFPFVLRAGDIPWRRVFFTNLPLKIRDLFLDSIAMKTIAHLVVVVALCAVPSLAPAQYAAVVPKGDENIPDAAAVRRQIDAQIHTFQRQKKKATLGLVQQSILLSISYGAPAYNAGDHAGCFRFYAATADALVTAFAEENSATPSGWRALSDLKAARDRTSKNANADHNAWTMRYAFDKTQIAWELEVGSGQGLMQLGSQNFQKSQFEEAQDAFESAGRTLHELDGQPLEMIPVACRLAPLALANALFAQKQYKPASDAVVKALHYLPEWPAMTIDLRSLHHDPAEYEAMLENLQATAKAAPDDAALQFLLGYELFFTGKKSAAHAQFERTLKLDPNHIGAKMFLHPGQRPDDEPAPPRPVDKPGTVKT